MNQEINEKENQKEQTNEKRQPVYRKEAMQKAMNHNHTLNFANGVGRGIEKAGKAGSHIGTGIEKTMQHMKTYMDGFDM